MSELVSVEVGVFDALEQLRSDGGIILEVGANSWPSPAEGNGRIYSGEGDIHYVALDLPSQLVNLRGGAYESPAVGANMNAIPLADASVDVCIMRSVFGQLTGSYLVTNIEDIRTWGMMELARVLKPGGQVLIFEENTPWYKDYIESYGRSVGFEVAETIYKFSAMDQQKPFERWGQVRQYFYNPENDRSSGKGYGDKDFTKCVVLKKPQDAVMVEKACKVCINTHDRNYSKDGEWIERTYEDGWTSSRVHYPNAIYKELIFKTINHEETRVGDDEVELTS